MANGPGSFSGTSYYPGNEGNGSAVPPYTNGYAANGYTPAGHAANGYTGNGYAPGFDSAYAPRAGAYSEEWAPATHSGRPADTPTAGGYGGYAGEYAPPGYGDPADATAAGRTARRSQERQASYQRGVPGWLALLIMLAIAALGGLAAKLTGNSVQTGFNVALIVASVVAILAVRHRDMFPIVVAPPLVYIVGSGLVLYIRSGGLHNRKILIDAAANWLVYGFPAIAGATAGVLIIAGVRLVLGK